MTTDDLIRALAADGHVGREPAKVLLVALVPATAFVAIVFFTHIGFRVDIDAALHTVRFLFKFAVIVPLAVVTVGALLRSTGPIPALGWWTKLLPLPPLVLCAGAAAELLAIPPSDWVVRLIGSNAVNCMTLIPLLASGPLVLFITALKSGAPAHPGWSGAIAGLAASSLAAVFYAMNCFDDSPLFVMTWYPLAMLTVVSAGYFAGVRYLRW
ncbi:MAG: NrsF family protein [Bradyrhizobium sp.]